MPATNTSAEPKAVRAAALRAPRWRQFSLRTLLLFTLASSLLMAWIVHKRHEAAEQQAAWKLIVEKRAGTNFGPESARPPWLCWILGADVAAQGACVEFGNSGLTDEDVATLCSLRNLQRVSLDGNPITDRGVAHLRKLSRLSNLSLSETRITDAGLESLRSCKSLEWLVVDQTSTTDAGVQQLRTALPGISIVDAKGNEWPPLKPTTGAMP